MSEDYVLEVFPVAWAKIKEHIAALSNQRLTAANSRYRKKTNSRSIHIDAIATQIGSNAIVFRQYLDNKDFVEESKQKYHTDERVADRVRKIVRFYWNMVALDTDSRALSHIFMTAMRTPRAQLMLLERYVGSHQFIHLDRKGELFEGPVEIRKTDSGELIFVHGAALKQSTDDTPIAIDYQGIVVPYAEGMVLLSVGANLADPYLRMLNARTVFDPSTEVTFGIYSGTTTSDSKVFSARAALIPSEIWQSVSRNAKFKTSLKLALADAQDDNDGAIVLPKNLRTLFPR